MGYKTNNRWIKVNYDTKGNAYFRHNNKRYNLSDFIRCYNNPWNGGNFPSYIHGYYAHDYYNPMYIEFSNTGEAVKIYRGTKEPEYKCYTLRNYFDVWGNEKDGWEVNDSCIEFDDLHISEVATEKEILDYLVSIKFLTTSDRRRIRTEEPGDYIEIYEVKGHKPLAALIPNQ